MLRKASFLVVAVMLVTLLFASFPVAADEAEETEYVRFTALGNDPYATFTFSKAGNNTMIDPDTVTWAAIRYKTGSQYDSTGVEYTAQFYISPAAEPHVPIRYEFTGKWETAIIDLTAVSAATELESRWNSDFYTAVNTVRFDPLEPDRDPENTSADNDNGQVNEGDYIDIAWIAFFTKEADARAYTGKEDTPYCILDTASLLNLNGQYHLKAERCDAGGVIAPTEPPADVPVKYTVSPRKMDPMAFNGHTVAIEFTVPEGKSFKSFILTAAPTWGAQANSNLDAVIYAWDTDFDTTIEGTELGSFREEMHIDNMNLEMDFGVILPPGKYVIYMTAEDDTIGAWGGDMDEINFDALFYMDDTEYDTWFPYSDIMLISGTESAIVLPTAGPTKVPTEKPTAAPTAEPTAAPATSAPTAKPTDAPAVTDAPQVTEADQKPAEGKGLSTGAIIGIIACAAVVIGAVIAVFVVKGKKK